MTAHRFVPISRDLGYDGPTEWRCSGCGVKRSDPAPRLGDDCKAVELDLDAAS